MSITLNTTTATIVQSSTYSSIPCQVYFGDASLFMFDGKPYRGFTNRNYAASFIFDKADLTTAGLTSPTYALKISQLSGNAVDYRPDSIALHPYITTTDGQYYKIDCYIGLATAFTNARDSLGSQTATIIRGTYSGANLAMGLSGTLSQTSGFANLPVVVSDNFIDSDKDEAYKANLSGTRRITFNSAVPTTEDVITFGGVDYAVISVETYPEESSLYTAIARRL